ncbi:unnamed protein product [Urochloa humidicola]
MEPGAGAGRTLHEHRKGDLCLGGTNPATAWQRASWGLGPGGGGKRRSEPRRGQIGNQADPTGHGGAQDPANRGPDGEVGRRADGDQIRPVGAQIRRSGCTSGAEEPAPRRTRARTAAAAGDPGVVPAAGRPPAKDGGRRRVASGGGPQVPRRLRRPTMKTTKATAS